LELLVRLKFGCDLSGVFWLCTLVVCASGALASTSLAQATGATRVAPRTSEDAARSAPRTSGEQSEPTAHALLDAALLEQRQGNHAEALALFAEAHERAPSAQTLRGLGTTQFELHNHVLCIQHLEGALESTAQPLDARQRVQLENTLARAYGTIGRLFVNIVPASANVQLLVDGKPGTFDRERPLLFEPGAHQLELRAPGYLPAQRTFEARGKYEIWHVELAPDPKPASPEPVSTAAPTPAARPAPVQLAVSAESSSAPGALTLAPTSERPSRAPLYKSPWLWTTLGVAVAAGALAFGIMAARQSRTEVGEPVRTPNTQAVLSALAAGER
jgi:tetratricopeptide (TPR) repeat protein